MFFREVVLRSDWAQNIINSLRLNNIRKWTLSGNPIQQQQTYGGGKEHANQRSDFDCGGNLL
jgi:hypothetical protein